MRTLNLTLLILLLLNSLAMGRVEIDTLSVSPEPIDTALPYTYEPVRFANGNTLPITGEEGIYRLTFTVDDLRSVDLPTLYLGASPYPVLIQFNGRDVFRWGHSLSDFRMQTVRPFSVPLHAENQDSGTVEILFYTQGQKTAFRKFWIDSEQVVTDFVFIEDMIGADGIKVISVLSLLLGILIIYYYFLSKKQHPEILYLGLFAFFEGIGYTLFIADGSGMLEIFWYKFSRPGFPLAMTFFYSGILRLHNITDRRHLIAEKVFYGLAVLATLAIWFAPSLLAVAQIFSYFAGVVIIYPIFGIVITILFKSVFVEKRRDIILLFIGFSAVIFTSSVDLRYLLVDQIPYAWFSAYGQFTLIFLIIITIGKHEQKVHDQLMQMTSDLQRSNEELIVAHEQTAHESELRENFIRAVAHELRTPLNAAMGIVHELADKSDENYPLFAASINRLGLAITNIFTYQSLDDDSLTLTLTPINLEEICREILSYHAESAHNKGVSLSVEVSEQSPLPPEIISCRTAWELIINNAVSNAVKFTDEGEVKVELSYSDDAVTLCVQDTGCGISDEELASIFKEFNRSGTQGRYTRKVNQIGIGLRISKKQVDLLGGSITLQNRQGAGSELIVEVPAEKAVSTVPVKRKTGNRGSSILVVDDNDTNCQILSAILSIAKFDYTVKHNGLEAVHEMEENGDSYGLILMDIQMPIMNGIEASREIRVRGFETSIIALTANADREECMNAGMNEYLEKPYSRQTLLSVIDQFMA